MDVLKFVGIAVVAVVLISIIKNNKQEYAIQLTIVTGVVLFAYILTRLTPVLSIFESLAGKAGLADNQLGAIIKIVGIAYVADFGSEICRDAGESSIAHKVDLAGKVLILIVATPILGTVLDLLTTLLK